MARSNSGPAARCASARSRRFHIARTRRSRGVTSCRRLCSDWRFGAARQHIARPAPLVFDRCRSQPETGGTLLLLLSDRWRRCRKHPHWRCSSSRASRENVGEAARCSCRKAELGNRDALGLPARWTGAAASVGSGLAPPGAGTGGPLRVGRGRCLRRRGPSAGRASEPRTGLATLPHRTPSSGDQTRTRERPAVVRLAVLDLALIHRLFGGESSGPRFK